MSVFVSNPISMCSFSLCHLQFTAFEKPQTDVVLKTRATPWTTRVCQEKGFLFSADGEKAAAVQQAKNNLVLGE